MSNADIIDTLNEITADLEKEIAEVVAHNTYDTFDRGLRWGLVKACLKVSEKRQALLPPPASEDN